MSCALCPRKCGVNRSKKTGYCGQSDKIKIARAALHYWEEPCISGSRGSGTVFFSGCTLNCVFCQNFEISQQKKGYYVTPYELAEIFLDLQNQGAHNLNLVSPTPFVPSIMRALDEIKRELKIPVVYNCGGYESVETVEMLRGYVNVWLPDLKYYSDEAALKYSGAKNYFETAMEAISKMYSQTGRPVYGKDGTLKRGVLVRHLVLPNMRHDSEKVIAALRERFEPDEILLSVMSQYTPMNRAGEFKELNRRVSTFEYNYVLGLAREAGFDGFSQERNSAEECYVPPFEGE